MKSRLWFIVIVLFFSYSGIGQTNSHNLHFDKLAKQWDEAIPIGNGMLGALVWQKDNNLRFSLDRADLWDTRPMKGLHRKEFSYGWVIDQVNKKDYSPVQQYFDDPYDMEPAPSKIPGGALEFDTKTWGNVESVDLYVNNATCKVKWENGIILTTFVHATQPEGWFKFENITSDFNPQLLAPRYQGEVKIVNDPVGGDDLARLGYKQGEIKRQGYSIVYKQDGWGSFKYEVSVNWKKIDATTFVGVWSISSKNSNKQYQITASRITKQLIKQQYEKDYASHVKWWSNFWNKSAISLPDSLLEKQWYLEQYKFGSTSRIGAPPISLQAIWTADNGRLPPWKGDYHHDLNTQLSYWPSYSSNHLEEGLAYYNYLDKNLPNYKRYTKQFFGKEGLAVPGVSTLDGTEMGGWIQYAFSPTVSSWLGQHYYLQWRYSMDRKFLKTRAYPWIKETAKFLEDVTVIDEKGYRKLPISSSPEINDNDITAWFHDNTNYDLALMKFTFKAAAELAAELHLAAESKHWKSIEAQFTDFAISPNNELMFAPTMAYNQSHRHFSNMMAIHPLGLIKWEDGNKAQSIIRNSIYLLDSIGPSYWCGYSYAWLANMKARAKDGLGAAEGLHIFVNAFCSVNSFHLNGDQTKSGYSKYTYRPFTLEGNFAYAAGLQEMLLQSYAGFIDVMPAVPTKWKDISFKKLRAEGAFLIDAKKVNGQLVEVKIFAEKGGIAKLKLPFKTWVVGSKKYVVISSAQEGFVTLKFKPGGFIYIRNDANNIW